MKKIIPLIYFILSILNTKAQQNIMGFTSTGTATQINWEKQFNAQLDTGDLDTWMKFLSSHPHNVGTIKDKANAEYIAALFKQWGYQTEIESYYVLYPTPK